jgi:hypothetical protein
MSRQAVICRPTEPGYHDSRPRFLTGCGGWTYDKRKARKFASSADALAELASRTNADWWLKHHTVERA